MNTDLTPEDYKNIAAQLRKPYGEYAVEIGERMNAGNLPMNLHTLAVLNPTRNDSILEIGMGNGHFVKNILNMDTSIQYTGCDYSEVMVQESEKRNINYVNQNRARFVQGNVQELPFEDNSFYKIFTINTFYFWDEYGQAINEIKRVLRPKRTLVLSVRPKHNLGKFPVTKYGFSIYSQEEIIAMITKEGLRFKEVTQIKEPSQEHMDFMFERECLILTFEK